MKPGSCAFPYYGVEFAIVEPKSGVELLGNDVEGVLCIKKPWPAIGKRCSSSGGVCMDSRTRDAHTANKSYRCCSPFVRC
jgi:acyl-coenzyme A synthetase/AMP-(fatty) acid ligase